MLHSVDVTAFWSMYHGGGRIWQIIITDIHKLMHACLYICVHMYMHVRTHAGVAVVGVIWYNLKRQLWFARYSSVKLPPVFLYEYVYGE